MSDGLIATLLLTAFLAATILAEVLRPRLAWIPMALLAVALLAGAVELARFDHGRPHLLVWVGFVGAPVGAILGGAAWGTRRFYGWPDLGPHPSRLALASLAVLLGVLIGGQVREADIRASQDRAEALRQGVLAWRTTHGGAWPTTLADAAPRAPASRMGAFDPPPFTLGPDAQGRTAISFPLSSRAALVLGLEDGRWRPEERGAAGGLR